jgi:P-type Cu2+ transporter
VTGAAPAASCFHCGLPIAGTRAPSAVLAGEIRRFCCAGCRAVAELIFSAGSEAYYARRSVPAQRADALAVHGADADLLADDPRLQARFTRDVAGGREALLVLDGAQCSACAWLIERQLAAVEGVCEARVSIATARVRVVWDPGRTRLSAVLRGLRAVGFAARPYLADAEEAQQRLERQHSLRRLGVAGLGSMQVMMFAAALYAGASSGIADAHAGLLRVASLAVATGVVAFSAAPFFRGALRDLRARAPGMDVPVALAIAIAYGASAWATVRGSGEVYFESACMFTFLLGLTRHLELSARHARDARIRRRLDSLPEVAVRLGPAGVERVPASSLVPGERVALDEGAGVPADGQLLEGSGVTDEALLTGEAAARAKRPGDRLIGGSRWLAGRGVMRVDRTGAEGTAARIAALLERAQLDRPPAERLADRVATVFVSGMIVCAALVAGFWAWCSPADALPITLSVLVATCPCALSLATPAALASASAGLSERGFLITRGHVLETLARVTHVVFDKTGTLTRPRHRITRVVLDRGWSESAVDGLVRALERWSDHPIAGALRSAEPSAEAASAEAEFAARLAGVRVHAGRGVEGELDGRRVRVGRPDWAAPGDEALAQEAPARSAEAELVLGIDGRAVARIELAAVLRDDARPLVAALRGRGLALSLASGDPSREAVAGLAEHVGIERWRAGATPEEKVALVAALQAAGAVVAVVGDGQNDAPVLGRADVGLALGGGADLARVSADAVVLDDRLAVLEQAWQHAARTRRVLRQNLTWSAAYNLSILPAAAAGYVTPWMAALGMSLSSLVVVASGLRLRRVAALPSAPPRAPQPRRPAWRVHTAELQP